MVEIRLHNTATRRKEVFAPIDPANVRMYVCGPTVYDRAHLGNARPVVVFDVLFRLLRHVYGEAHVTYVRNFTDVDDKINAKAAETGRPIREITDETIGWYHADMDALGALRPTHEPRATEYIEEMKAMIALLIEKGFAYTVREPSNNPPKEYVLMDRERALGDHALFAVDSFPDYGKLSGRSVEDMIASARAEKAPHKRNPADFVLWKPSDASLPGWDSPWGRGRPGWHIECSAMARALLGETFDIHGGGIDLQFPHHENEIAQSRCAHPDEGFAKLWMHNEMLLVEGKKMSKSLGNFFTVRNLLDQGVPGEVIRFVLLSTHYSKPMDWTEEKVKQAQETLRKWRSLVERQPVEDSPHELVVEPLKDDLNTSLAISGLHTLAKTVEMSGHGAGRFKASAAMLGLLTDELVGWYADEPAIEWLVEGEELRPVIKVLIGRLIEARTSRNFTVADRLRDTMRAAGVEISFDRDGGVTYKRAALVDRHALEALL